MPIVIVLVAVATGLALYVHRLMTNGDNLDYLFISWLTRTSDALEPFKWRFPVGYPYLLSGWLWATGQRAGGEFFTLSPAVVASAKWFGISLVVPAFLAMTFWLRLIRAPFPYLLGLLLATSQTLMVQFSIIGAEPLFICCSFLALIFWESLVRQEKPPLKLWLGAAACMLAAVQARQIGMAIPAAGLLYLLIYRKRHAPAWRRAAFWTATIPMLQVILVMVFSNSDNLVRLATGGGGGQSFRPEKLIDGFSVYRMVYPSLVFPKCFGSAGILHVLGLSFLGPILAIGMYVALALGVIRIFRSAGTPGRISALYCFVSAGILLVWPFQDFRFWVPMLPIMLWATALGLTRIFGATVSKPEKTMVVLIAAWIAFQGATDVSAARKNLSLIWHLRSQPPWQPERYVPTSELDFAGLLDAGAWIGAHAPAGSRIVSSKALFAQISARRLAVYPDGVRQAMSHADENKTPLYLIWDSFSGSSYGQLKIRYLQPVLQANPERFSLVYTSPYLETKVYRYVVP